METPRASGEHIGSVQLATLQQSESNSTVHKIEDAEYQIYDGRALEENASKFEDLCRAAKNLQTSKGLPEEAIEKYIEALKINQVSNINNDTFSNSRILCRTSYD